MKKKLKIVDLQKNREETYSDSSERFLDRFFNKPQSEKRKEIVKTLSSGCEWPILYHLSPQREFLLEWYPFNKNSTLLEIGAGCGALTDLFCRKVKKVYANELSKKRAGIIAKRYSDKNNLEIYIGNFLDIDFKEKFDYITVIGVLEYSGRYIQDKGNEIDGPYIKFMKEVVGRVKPNGEVFIAIENKIGLKYFAGGREDHYGDLFSSIENYPNYSGIKTFTQRELKNLLLRVGFKNIQFYYPYPDYKLPHTILSQNDNRKINISLSSYLPVIDHSSNRYPLFNEVICGFNFQRERILKNFANSFLVIAKL